MSVNQIIQSLHNYKIFLDKLFSFINEEHPDRAFLSSEESKYSYFDIRSQQALLPDPDELSFYNEEMYYYNRTQYHLKNIIEINSHIISNFCAGTIFDILNRLLNKEADKIKCSNANKHRENMLHNKSTDICLRNYVRLARNYHHHPYNLREENKKRLKELTKNKKELEIILTESDKTTKAHNPTNLKTIIFLDILNWKNLNDVISNIIKCGCNLED